MKIKNNTSTKVTPFTVVAIIGVLCLSFFVLTNNEKSKTTLLNNDDLDTRTRLPTIEIEYNELFSSSDYVLHDDDELSIYLMSGSAIPKIIYAYKNEISDRQLTDSFFLHVYLKDSSKLKKKAHFANADFIEKPKTFLIEGKTYYVFQRDLTSSNYKEGHIPINNIDYINTGRFKPTAGRSLDLRKLDPSNIPNAQLNNGLDKISISISKKAYNKIKDKRDDALSKGILISQDDDLVNGSVRLNNGDYQKVELRLKGDWTDHLKHENKWSYRLIMKGRNTFKGMRKFSIQHPVVRNHLWEWLFNKTVKDNGIIGLRYNYADVTLTVKDITDIKIPIGIMAIEESFDKILIENNKKREGIILTFDESLLWKDREKQRILGLERKSQSKDLHSIHNAPIKVFNQNKVLSDPKLLKQFETAKDLLEGLRQGEYMISDVFDVDKLTTFLALSNLFGGYHGLIWHNLRIYYNPITNKLEPISFDSNSGIRLTELVQYPMSENDTIFQEKLIEKLKLVSSSSFVNNLVARHAKELIALEKSMSTEYNQETNLDILVYNSNFIKKKINPAVLITASLLSHDKEFMTVALNNVSGKAITVQHLENIEGAVLGSLENDVVLNQNSQTVLKFKLSDYFVNAFVSKKNKKGAFQYPKDVQKLKIAHAIKGVGLKRLAEIKPYATNSKLTQSVAQYKQSRTPNYTEFAFIKTHNDTLVLKKGKHSISKNLIIPSGFIVIAETGFSLDFINGASVLSTSPFQLEGTPDLPITFFSSNGTGGGIFVTNANEPSQLSHCVFDNLSNPQSEIWSVSGAVNFHESDVTITHTSFKNNRCDDGLNIIRSSFVMTDTVFEGTQSDAFDGDFVSGTLERCTFLNSGNDGIDVSGSELVLKDITINNPSDKAISAGENSTIKGEDITIANGEIGVVSKDLSTINLNDVSISRTRLGLSAFQKKSEYGVATISVNNLALTNIEVNHLIEVNSNLTIDNVAVETVSNNVIDQMYGKEYGKSSK